MAGHVRREICRMPRVVALLAALNLVLWGCSPQRVETFTVTLRDASGSNLPVFVNDNTSTIERVDGLAITDATTPVGVANAPEGQDVLVATWLGGTCDRRVSFDFTKDGTEYLLSGHTVRDAGCTLAGVTRSIVIKLGSPVSAESVTFGSP